MNENVVLDIKAIQKDRAATMPGYRLVTFDEMEIDPPAKQWLIKGIFARGETSAWIAPPGAMKSALLAEGTICVGAGLDWHGYATRAPPAWFTPRSSGRIWLSAGCELIDSGLAWPGRRSPYPVRQST
jgi:hypothetical protein